MFSIYNGVNAVGLEPTEFSIGQNYPNPFKDKTVIKYCVAYKTKVLLAVYDLEGNLIEKLVDEEKNPGTYEVEFDASTCHSCESKNPDNEAYYYRMEATPIVPSGRQVGGQAGEYRSEKKMQLIK